MSKHSITGQGGRHKDVSSQDITDDILEECGEGRMTSARMWGRQGDRRQECGVYEDGDRRQECGVYEDGDICPGQQTSVRKA